MCCAPCEAGKSRSAEARIRLRNDLRNEIKICPALQLLIGLILGALAGLQTKPVYVPLPTREALDEIALDEIELRPHAFSTENTTEFCERTVYPPDPLIDLPSLPAVHKDTIMELLQNAEVVSSNSFQRLDVFSHQVIQ